MWHMEPHLRPPGKIKETKLELSKESLLNLHRSSWVSSDADTKTFILADKRSTRTSAFRILFRNKCFLGRRRRWNSVNQLGPTSAFLEGHHVSIEEFQFEFLLEIWTDLVKVLGEWDYVSVCIFLNTGPLVNNIQLPSC